MSETDRPTYTRMAKTGWPRVVVTVRADQLISKTYTEAVFPAYISVLRNASDTLKKTAACNS